MDKDRIAMATLLDEVVAVCTRELQRENEA